MILKGDILVIHQFFIGGCFMIQFDDTSGKRRRLNIRNMKKDDVSNYCLQFFSMKEKEKLDTERELQEKIENNEERWVLAITSLNGDIVGKMEVEEVGPKVGSLVVEIPNASLVRHYGTEAIDQFVKICRERKYFSKIELEKNNLIAQRYRTIHEMATNVLVV